MDLNLIKKLVRIVDTSEITDLEVEENGLRIKIAKKIRGIQTITQPQILAQSSVIPEQFSSKTVEEKAAEKPSNLHEIRSPIVGTFYRAPAPDADASVN